MGGDVGGATKRQRRQSGVGMGDRDVRIHVSRVQARDLARFAPANGGAAAVGQGRRRLHLHPLHLRHGLRLRRRLHSGENRRLAFRQAFVLPRVPSQKDPRPAEGHEQRFGARPRRRRERGVGRAPGLGQVGHRKRHRGI